MKTHELMIGDWVYNSYHKKNIQWNYREMFCPNGNPVIGKDLHPIPLTAKIMEKNGFLDIDDLGAEKCNGHNIYYKIGGGGYGINELGLRLYFVHQLQHALRLCGLDELADGFKI